MEPVGEINLHIIENQELGTIEIYRKGWQITYFNPARPIQSSTLYPPNHCAGWQRSFDGI